MEAARCGGPTTRAPPSAGCPSPPATAGCTAQVVGVSFTSSQVGYVLLGSGTVLRTADGGRTFGQRTSVPGGSTASDIDFVSDDVGTAVSGGRVYRTVNGGNSWTAISAAGGGATEVRFVDPATAVAVGGNGTFLTSSDGGATFTAKPLTGEGAGKDYSDVACVNASTCLLTLGGSQVVRTADGGATSSLVASADSPLTRGRPGRPRGTRGRGRCRTASTVASSQDAGATFAPIGSNALPAGFGTAAVGLRRAGPTPWVGDAGRVARTAQRRSQTGARSVCPPPSGIGGRVVPGDGHRGLRPG